MGASQTTPGKFSKCYLLQANTMQQSQLSQIFLTGCYKHKNTLDFNILHHLHQLLTNQVLTEWGLCSKAYVTWNPLLHFPNLKSQKNRTTILEGETCLLWDHFKSCALSHRALSKSPVDQSQGNEESQHLCLASQGFSDSKRLSWGIKKVKYFLHSSSVKEVVSYWWQHLLGDRSCRIS